DQRAEGGQPRADRPGDEERAQVRPPARGLQAGRAQEHEPEPRPPAAFDRAGRDQVTLALDLDRARHERLARELQPLRVGQVRRVPVEVDDPDQLVLLGEERPHVLEPAERAQAGLLLVLDQLRLAGEAVEVRVLDGAPRQDRADAEGDPDRGDHDQDRGEEEELAKRQEPPGPHGETALYPAPRTVRISSGRPSFRRSWPTWT